MNSSWSRTLGATGRRAGILTVLASTLAGCGLGTAAPVSAPSHPHPQIRTMWVPHVTWHPVSVGSPVLLAEGAQISSVLAGPQGRIYYGTTNPLENANVIGWINPTTGANQWTSVPSANPPFPKSAGMDNLNAQQAALWDGVSLVVSGRDTVWYRHWGYVGGWLVQSGRFTPGDYADPGPTVTDGQWTASLSTTFAGATTLRLMNLQTRAVTVHPIPPSTPPVALSLANNPSGPPTIWMLSNQTVWVMPGGSTHWQSVASLEDSDFFVAMGQWGDTMWTIDADGNIDEVTQANGLSPVATVSVSPLDALSAPNGGLWIASPNHLSLWEPHQPLKSWSLPKSPYTAPASTWAISGPNEPPNWPPAAHLSQGANGSALVGIGTWIGTATVVPERVTVSSKGASKHDQ